MLHIKKSYGGKSGIFPHGVVVFFPRSDTDMVLAHRELESLRDYLASSQESLEIYYADSLYMLSVKPKKNSKVLVKEWRTALYVDYERWKAQYRRESKA